MYMKKKLSTWTGKKCLLYFFHSTKSWLNDDIVRNDYCLRCFTHFKYRSNNIIGKAND